MKAFYDAVGLTPHRAAFLHLLLIGIPLRFGLLPTAWGRRHGSWGLSDSILPEPCTVLNDHVACTVAEELAVRDYGYRFVLHYELAWVVWFLMVRSYRRHRFRRENQRLAAALYFHRVLLACSLATVFCLAWLQNYSLDVPSSFSSSSSSSSSKSTTGTTEMADNLTTESELHPDFVNGMTFYHMLASALSLWTVLVHSSGHEDAGLSGTARRPGSNSIKWSIPANSIYFGAAVNVLVAVASGQALLKGTVRDYYANLPAAAASPAVYLCFALSAFHTALHATMLFQIRNLLTMPQLRTVCLYKLIVNLVLPWMWFPDRTLTVSLTATRLVRLVVMCVYLNGYWWAGKAEGVSRILTGEKED